MDRGGVNSRGKDHFREVGLGSEEKRLLRKGVGVEDHRRKVIRVGNDCCNSKERRICMCWSLLLGIIRSKSNRSRSVVRRVCSCFGAARQVPLRIFPVLKWHPGFQKYTCKNHYFALLAYELNLKKIARLLLNSARMRSEPQFEKVLFSNCSKMF